ncbi:MAG TPA: MFS transporter [Pedococcus sp.]|jgi:MFS family permease|nr:MFS transporter [Pedococcus sp.]
MYLNEPSTHGTVLRVQGSGDSPALQVPVAKRTRVDDRAPTSRHAAAGRFRLGRRTGFWAIAASLASLTAFSTAPSPLYGIYAQQDHLSSITITAVYAVYAVGVVASLLLVGHVSDWYGRRPVLISALLVALVAALIFCASTSLPALFTARVLTGVALGAAIATASAYLTDLDLGPGGSATRRSQVVSSAANVGGLATGPLLAGLLARYVPGTPRLPYLIFAILLVLAVMATAAAPEGRPVPKTGPRYHPQRLAAPSDARAQFNAALIGALSIFTVYGVFAGLAGAFLAGPLHHPSTAWAGVAVFLTFGTGILTQITTRSWSLRHLLRLGVPALLLGLTAVVAAAWVTPPSLTLFFAGALLVGAGSGTISRGALTIVITTAAANNRAGAVASYFVVGYLGLSLPVLAAGIALQHVTFQVTLLVLSVAAAAGILLASRYLLRLPTPKTGDTPDTDT